MPLRSGLRLGVYEVLAPIGAGGMGEVYRARDTRLGRDVALKVVRDDLGKDAELRARFEGEARLLAALNHPNIAAIYGLEETDDTRALVLELVEGETLAERLARGAVTIDEALSFGEQTASALAAAHEKGIVHRDLKPLNIRVTSSGLVKVLDFGLATTPSGAREAPLDSRSPTQPFVAITTAAGFVVGTPAYMSPEQLRGKPLDARTDLWGFGCVLYEALTGRPAFTGETMPDLVAAILGHEPDFGALPSGLPSRARRLVRRCLRKAPEKRLGDAAEAASELHLSLEERRGASRRGTTVRRTRVLAGPGGAGPAEPPDALTATGKAPPNESGAPAAAGTRAVATGGLERKPAPRKQPRLSQLTIGTGVEEFPALSADGRQLFFATASGGLRRLARKDLETGEETVLTAGESDDIQPAPSPDGQRVLFVRARQPGKRLEPGDVFGQYADGDVCALELATGAVTLLVENAFNPSFSPDGSHIALDASWAGPRRIWTVDGRGRNPRQVTSDDSEALVHVRPRWSPDGRRIVFQNQEKTKFDVRIVDLASQRMTWVTNDLFQDFHPVFSPSGRAVCFTSYRSGGLNLWRVGVSREGRPTGAPRQLTMGAGQDVEAASAPGADRLVFATLRQNADLWRLPVSPETGRPEGPPEPLLATTREESRGAFAPDGQTIAFNSDRSGDMNLWLLSLRDRSVRQLTHGPGGDYQPVFTPDGARLIFFSTRSGHVSLWSVSVATGALTRLTEGDAIDVNPCVSPDGRTIAFQSDRSGRLEVFAMDAGGGEPRQLTTVGVAGHFLRFTREGSHVLFRCPVGTPRTMLVPLSGGEARPTAEVVGGAHMSLSPGGTKVLDVLAHKALWVSPLDEGRPEMVFEHDDPSVRIDYPVWAPDGRSVLYDRFRPEGGDIWALQDFE